MGKSSFGKIGCAIFCSACLGANAPAQNPATTQPVPTQVGQNVGQAQPGQIQPGQGQAGQGQLGQGQPGHGQAGQSQNMIANCLVYENQAEVALGRMAQEKAESGAVKKFAGMMVEDHQGFLTKLQKFAPNAGELSQNHGDSSGRSGNEGRNASVNQRDGQGAQNQGAQNQGAQNQGNQNQGNQDQIGSNNRNTGNAAQQTAGHSGDMSNLVMIQKELAQQCLSDSQQKLSKEEGEKFDKCYMGMQIVAHAGMKSKLTVFARHASGELKQLIDQGLQTTEKHLKEAESIMKDIDGDSDNERRSTDRSASPDKSENKKENR